MKPNDIIVTQKMKDIFKSKKKVIHCEGVTGSSKSFILGVKFFFEVFKADANKKQFVIGASTTSIAERMFIDNPASFYNIFRPICNHKQQGVGGNRIVIDTPTGEKIVYLVGYDDVTRYKQILGLGIHGFLIEEIHTARDEFIREMFTRVARDDGLLFTSSNGGIPELMVYVDYLNKARPHPLYIKDVPDSTMGYLLESDADDDFEFWFFKFEDNPTLSKDQIARLYRTHPVGSFEYNSKILGIRGYTEGALFGYLIKPEHTVEEDKINYGAVIDVYVGMDVGSGVEGEKQARTVAIPVALSRGYQRAVVLDGWLSNEAEHIKVIKELEPKLQDLMRRFSYKVRAIYIDSAERTLINTFRNNKTVPVSVESSIKFTKFINASSRVSMKEQLLLSDRLLFANNEGAQMVKEQLMRVKGKNGEVVDENMLHNDINDALDYGLTPKFHEIMNSKRG